jgi:predicted Na+-dependent transporter
LDVAIPPTISTTLMTSEIPENIMRTFLLIRHLLLHPLVSGMFIQQAAGGDEGWIIIYK